MTFYYCPHCEAYWHESEITQLPITEHEPFVHGDMRSVHTTTTTAYYCPTCASRCFPIAACTCDSCKTLVPAPWLVDGTDTCKLCTIGDLNTEAMLFNEIYNSNLVKLALMQSILDTKKAFLVCSNETPQSYRTFVNGKERGFFYPDRNDQRDNLLEIEPGLFSLAYIPLMF